MPKLSSNISGSSGEATKPSDTPSEPSVTVKEPLDTVSFSPLHVEGDPKYVYYWASTRRNHPQNVHVLQRMGYEVVPPEGHSSEVTPFAEERDGGRVVDDLILMRMPKEQAERLRQRRADAYRQRLSQYEEEMTSFAENVDGVTVITEPSERTSFYFPNNPLAKR